MNSIFQELLHEGVLANYMDDFVILAKTMEELKERTIRFLKIAEKHNLCFKRSKCDFNMEEIPILGVVISKGQIQMEQEKIKAVKEWKIPTKVKDMESFLGFANFYWCFIQNFSHTAKLLNELKGKKEWKWEEEHQRVFEELKEKITSQPVLALPRREGKFRVEMDASRHAIGGVLFQEQEGKWKPIAFLSRTMQLAEWNYEIYNKELLVIVEVLAKWRQYLLDAAETFEIWMDHENLKYFQKPHKLNRWQARWYLKLQDVRRGSHRGGSPQNGLGDERTCGTTLASAYVLRHLSATWLQLQMKERKSEWKWVLNGVSPLNTRDRVQ